MDFYRKKILPRLINWAMDRDSFRELRQRALKDLKGTVLEIGFGTGLNLPFYPSAVERLIALDPVPVSGKFIEANRAKHGLRVERLVGSGEALPQEDASVDHVVTTWTLCSVDDPDRVLSEVARVLKPGGTYVFVEHGKSNEPRIARLQNMLTPINQIIGGGCRLNRPIGERIGISGLSIEQMENFHIKGPKVGTYTFYGRARKK